MSRHFACCHCTIAEPLSLSHKLTCNIHNCHDKLKCHRQLLHSHKLSFLFAHIRHKYVNFKHIHCQLSVHIITHSQSKHQSSSQIHKHPNRINNRSPIQVINLRSNLTTMQRLQTLSYTISKPLQHIHKHTTNAQTATRKSRDVTINTDNMSTHSHTASRQSSNTFS